TSVKQHTTQSTRTLHHPSKNDMGSLKLKNFYFYVSEEKSVDSFKKNGLKMWGLVYEKFLEEFFIKEKKNF
ncbi:hypothetical protein ACFQY8_03085, partial [Alloscardovia venturai]